jgi:hypothetical protein
MYPTAPEVQAIAATYGSVPLDLRWPDYENHDVLPLFYGGIFAGGARLAGQLSALPPGDVNVILHSHGGNVLLVASYLMSRPLDHVITLGTPVNYDFNFFNMRGFGVSVNSRCQVSTSAGDLDFQFLGASPWQLYFFFANAYNAGVDIVNFGEALANGDDDSAAYWLIQFFEDTDRVEAFAWSTKLELWGPTYVFPGLSHGALHEPPVWWYIRANCAID